MKGKGMGKFTGIPTVFLRVPSPMKEFYPKSPKKIHSNLEMAVLFFGTPYISLFIVRKFRFK